MYACYCVVAALTRPVRLLSVLVATHFADSPVRTVAVCAGSGGSLLAGQQADLLLTGEMSHHEVTGQSRHRSDAKCRTRI